MRITQNMMQRLAVNTVQGHARQLATAQQRAMTGLRIQKASDDPVGAAGTMQSGGSLRALDQYRRNMQTAQSRADVEESSLDGLSNLMIRAKELAMGQGSDTASASTRAVVKAEVDQLLRSAAQLGNAQIAGSYVFGGNRADKPPVVWTGVPEVPTVDTDILEGYNHRTEIAAGQVIKVNHNALELFPGSPEPVPGEAPPRNRNALEALAALSRALGDNDVEAIRGSLGDIDASHDHVQNLIGDAGARSNHLRLATSNLEALEINLRTFKSDLEEVDLERAITDLVGRQTAYQAAMMATSRVMGMTMMDYLR